MAYSGDLRVRLIRSVEKGKSARSQAKVFEVSGSTAVKWMQAFRAGGTRDPKPHRGGRRSALDVRGGWLRARVISKPGESQAGRNERVSRDPRCGRYRQLTMLHEGGCHHAC